MRFFFCILSFFYSQMDACPPSHNNNQKIFAAVINYHLKEQNDISTFFYDIDLIGKEALGKGLDLSCYTYSKNFKTQALSYDDFLLWEGKEIIFLLYVWPSQEEANKACAKDTSYKTNIHSHPIPCAFTVLQGEITEERYQRLNFCNKLIQFCGKQIFYPQEKSVDGNPGLFIHQLFYEGKGSAPAITLHAYGCSSFERFAQILKETRDQHVYPESCVVAE